MKKVFTLIISMIYVLHGMAQTSVETIDIETSAQIDSMQDLIRDYIWPNGKDDSATVASIEQNLTPERGFPTEYAEAYTKERYSEEFTHLKSMDKMILQLKPGFNNVGLLFYTLRSGTISISLLYIMEVTEAFSGKTSISVIAKDPIPFPSLIFSWKKDLTSLPLKCHYVGQIRLLYR